MLNLFKGYSTAVDQSKAVLKIEKILESMDDEAKTKVLAWLRVHYFERDYSMIESDNSKRIFPDP